MPNRNVIIQFIAHDNTKAAFATVGKSIKTLGALAGITGGVVLAQKLVRGFGDAIKAGAAFEKEMSAVAAITGATGESFAKLEDAARQMGVTTVFAASQAAEAQRNLAKAGLDTTQIITALPGVLRLAAAGEITIGKAAEFAADATLGMNRTFEQLNETVDILAFTANRSNQTIEEIASALSFTSASAVNMEVEIGELSAALALLADRGISASRSGAALNRAFGILGGAVDDDSKGLQGFQVDLQNADGSAVNFATALDRLTEAGINSRNALEVFGTRTGAAMAVLLRLGGDSLRGFQEEMATTLAEMDEFGGFAETVMSRKLDNLAGDTTLLRSAWEGLSIAFTEQGTPALRAVTQQLTALVRSFTETTEGAESLSRVIGDAIKVTSVLLQVVVKTANGLQSGFRGVIGVMKLYEQAMLRSRIRTLEFRDAVSNFFGDDSFNQELFDAHRELQDLNDELRELTKSTVESKRATDVLVQGLQAIAAAAGDTNGALDPTAAAAARIAKQMREAGFVTQEQSDKMAAGLRELQEAFTSGGRSTAEFVETFRDDIEEFANRAERSRVRIDSVVAGWIRSIRAADAAQNATNDEESDFEKSLKRTEEALFNAGLAVQTYVDRVGPELLEAFQIARAAGAPVSVLIEGMGEKFLDLVTAANAAGSVVSAAALQIATAFAKLKEEQFEAEFPDFGIGGPVPEPESPLARQPLPEAPDVDFDVFDEATEKARATSEAYAQLGIDVKSVFDDEVKQAGADFGAAIIDAAFGAKVAWGDFFKTLLKQIASAIASFLALRAAAAIFDIGKIAGGADGGVVTPDSVPGLQFGGIVGGAGGTDSVLRALTPGELVVPTSRLQAESIFNGQAAIVPRELLESAQGGNGDQFVLMVNGVFDGNHLERTLRRDPRATGNAMRFAADQGFFDDA